jgi:formamidopyrimidine-DNA glycosylase
VRVLDERILGGVRKAALARALTGRAFEGVRRHGKHLFVRVEDRRPRLSPDRLSSWLHLHFGMSGDLAYYGAAIGAMGDAAPPRFARVIFDFDNGQHLAYEDMRLFGVVDLTPSPEAYIAEHRLGPDPLELRLPAFRRLLEGRRGAAKALLMSQDVIAGVGNLYADETLYQTSIHPKRPASELGAAEVGKVFATLRRVLTGAIDRKTRGQDHPARYLIQHREEGERCRMCGGTIQRTVVFGRTTYYCGKHQS